MRGEAHIAIDYKVIPAALGGFSAININQFSGPVSDVRAAVVNNTAAAPLASGRWVDDYLGRDVARFFYKWGGSLSSALIRIRGRYDGDLDQFLLHLVFVLTELASVNHAAEARAKGAETVVVRRRGLNILSLSDITRIPRETVRRKLVLLMERSLVERGEDGLYYSGPETDIDQFFFALSPLFWDGVKPDR